MRDELMTEALCWEFESKITANYAYAVKANLELVCYCPHEICLVRVHPKRWVNTYFHAPGRHVAGCPNESRATDPSPYPVQQKPRPAQKPVKPIPNLLGPGLLAKRKTDVPTKADLLRLAAAVRALPARHPGTLEEVVDAWMSMLPAERSRQPLAIGELELTYGTAFAFLGSGSDEIDSLGARRRIIFGAATVEEKDHCFLIQSRKRFLLGTSKFPLRLVSKKRHLVPNYFPTLVDVKATLFWHGVAPSLNSKGNAFSFEIETGSPYAGIALRHGEVLPWAAPTSADMLSKS